MGTVEQAAKDYGVEPDSLQEVMSGLGGVGESLDPFEVANLWGLYSQDLCAQWLCVDLHTMGNFAAWLIKERTP